MAGIAIIVLIFGNNWAIPLWNADEAAYAGIAHTMKVSGDWLNQNFIWSDVHRKPPLHLWLSTISMYLFGSNEWAIRFFSSVSVLTLTTVIFSWISERYNKTVGLLSAIVFVANILVLALAKIGFTDATLMLFEFLSVWSLYKISQNYTSRKYLVIFWASVALGLLTKGPHLVLVIGMMTLLVTFTGFDRKIILKIKPWIGLPLSLLPLTIWGYLSWQSDGGIFIRWMLDWYILKRVGGSVFGQSGPPGYYFGILLLAFFPFLVGITGILRDLIKRKYKLMTFEGFLLLWLLSGWLFFELVPSKLPNYIVGALPPLAILIGIKLSHIRPNDWKSIWFRLGAFLQLVLSALIAAVLVYLIRAEFGFSGILIAILTGLVPIIAVIIFILRLEAGRLEGSGLVLGTFSIIFGLLISFPLMNVVSPLFGCPKEIGENVGFELSRHDTILLAKEEIHMVSLPFYLSQQANVITDDDVTNKSLEQLQQFDAIIGDSLMSERLKATHNIELFSCYDMNHQKHKDFYVMVKQ